MKLCFGGDLLNDADLSTVHVVISCHLFSYTRWRANFVAVFRSTYSVIGEGCYYLQVLVRPHLLSGALDA